MSGVNKIILVGRVGKNPESKQFQSGDLVARFSVATSDKFIDQDGQQRENTQWHRVVTRGNLAGIVNQYISKGQQIYVEGKMQSRKWKDQNGTEREVFEVIANKVEILNNPQHAQSQPQQQPNQQLPSQSPLLHSAQQLYGNQQVTSQQQAQQQNNFRK